MLKVIRKKLTEFDTCSEKKTILIAIAIYK